MLPWSHLHRECTTLIYRDCHACCYDHGKRWNSKPEHKNMYYLPVPLHAHDLQQMQSRSLACKKLARLLCYVVPQLDLHRPLLLNNGFPPKQHNEPTSTCHTDAQLDLHKPLHACNGFPPCPNVYPSENHTIPLLVTCDITDNNNKR